MGDDLMGLAVVVVIAGGAFYLLTRNGNFSLDDSSADGFVDGGDPLDGTVDGTVSPAGVGKTCSQLCQAGNCADHAAKYCSGCSKCPNSGGTSAQCKAWCTASNCVEYRSKCNGTCSNCRTGSKCKACRKGYYLSGPGCTCHIKAGAKMDTYTGGSGPCPPGYELRARTDIPTEKGCYPIANLARAYTGRVTFNQSAPIQYPNAIPMSKPKPTTIPPQKSMFTRR